MSFRLRAALRPLPICLLLLTAPQAHAASHAAVAAPDTAVYVLPLETIVTATRQSIPLRENPAATTVVTRETLDQPVRGFDVGEELANVPGVRVDSPADAERVHLSIRGQGILTESGIRGIKVLLDGLPLNDPSGVAPDLYDVDWETVDRVEVLRGPSGALYGGGGSGGVLNIRTADGADVPVAGRASVQGGSYGFRKTLAEVGGTSSALNYRVSMSQAAADGWRDHNAFWGDNLYGKLRWTPSDRVQIQQVLAWTDYDEENAEGLNAEQVQQDPRQANPDAIPYDELFKTDRFTTGVTGRVALTGAQALSFATYLRATAYLEPRPHELVNDHSLAPGASLQYDLDSRAGVARNHLSLGGDAAWQGTEEQRFVNPGRATETALLANDNLQERGEGVFALDRVELPHDWSVMAGLRYDYMFDVLYDHPLPDSTDRSGRMSFQRVTGRAGVAWSPIPQANVYANWGQGFLPPSTEDFSNNPAGYAGFNQSLQAATSSGEEVGARGMFGERFGYELCGFLLDTQNDFDRYRLSSREGLTFYANAGSSRRWGAESRVTWKPTRILSLDAAYTWSRFRYTEPADIDGNELPNSPQHQFHLDTEVQLRRDLTLGIDTEMQSQWQLDTQNSAHVPGFALWNADLAYRWRIGGEHGTLSAGVRNLFGAAYMDFTEPDPDGNSYQPGPKQEYYGRLSWTH